MENNVSRPAKGYQKQIKKDVKDAQPTSTPKKSYNPDYSSPTAKKWPQFLEALGSGNTGVVKQLIEEGVNVNLSRDGVTPLMMAASKGQTEIAGVILEAGANINARSDDGWTALHKAAFDQPGTGVVDLLVQSGIDIEAKNKWGKTALQLAEEKKHRDIVRVIRKHQEKLSADAREWEEFLNTPEGKPYKQSHRYDSLTLAFKLWWLPLLALGGCGLVLGFLLRTVVLTGAVGTAAGFLIAGSILFWEWKLRTYLDKFGPLPPLDIHILREKRKAGEPILVGMNAGIKRGGEAIDNQSAAGASATDPLGQKAGNTFIAERNMREAPPVNKTGNLKVVYLAIFAFVVVLLLGLAFAYRESLTKWYFTKKVEQKGIRFSGQTFLDEVSENNDEAVDLFIKAGMHGDAENEQGQTALIIASEKGYVNLLAKLVKMEAPSLSHFDKSGNTALMAASRQGQENIVKTLVESGADVNYMVPSREGAASALQAALDASDFKEEHMRIVQYLLQRGADVKGKNSAGRFPLLFAADHGRTEVVGFLIEHGAEVNETDLKGDFPLLSAACKGYPWLTALLIEKGANIKMAAPDGHTPLMCAAAGGHIDTVKTLLEQGAAVNAKTASGATALTDAVRTGHVDVVKMLLDKGADPADGYLPDSFKSLKGRAVVVRAKKNKISDVLRRIAPAASQDGYTINADPNMEQKISLTTKASWNRVLNEVAAKNHLLLVVKDKEIFVLQYVK